MSAVLADPFVLGRVLPGDGAVPDACSRGRVRVVGSGKARATSRKEWQYSYVCGGNNSWKKPSGTPVGGDNPCDTLEEIQAQLCRRWRQHQLLPLVLESPLYGFTPFRGLQAVHGCGAL